MFLSSHLKRECETISSTSPKTIAAGSNQFENWRCFQIFFIFTPIFDEMIQFDSYLSKGVGSTNHQVVQIGVLFVDVCPFPGGCFHLEFFFFG